MANDSDWVDPSELGGMSRSGSMLDRLGYDPDEVRANPAMRAELMSKLASPYDESKTPSQRAQAIPAQIAAGAPKPPQPAVSAQPARPAQLAQPAQPPTVTPQAGGAANAQVSPSGGGGSRLDDIAIQGLQGGLGLANFAAQTAKDMAASPGPDTKDLEAQRVKDATPTAYRDPVTGKVNPQYKESFFGNVGRALNNMRLGAAGKPDEATDYSAPNKLYQTTEAARTARLGSEDQQLTNARDEFKAMTDARAKAAAEARQGVTGFNDVAKGAGEVQNADSNTVKANADALRAQTDAATRKDNSPEGQTAIQEARFGELNSQADRLGLKGQTRTLFLANNGKVPDPRQATAEEIARGQALRTWQKQNPGKQPTLDDINTINAAAGGRLKDSNANPASQREVEAIIAKKNAGIERANADHAQNHLNRDAYRQQLQAVQDAFEEEAAAAGKGGPHQVVTLQNGQPVWTTGTPQAAGKTPPPPGATHIVMGSDGKQHYTDGKQDLGLAE